MKKLVYSCPFVPAEWIAAHGLRPSRILPGPADASAFAGASAGVCPYAAAFLHAVSRDGEAEAAVLTTVCDQMRRGFEQAQRDAHRPVFLLNVPSSWQTATAQKIYISEIKRLGRFLVRLGGKEPSAAELAGVMHEYDARRSCLREARGRVAPRRFSEAIAQFHREGTVDPGSCEGACTQRGIPVALVGGPMMSHHFPIFDLIERGGGAVVLDATESGERTMPLPLDRRSLGDDPFMTLVEAYFGKIPDAFRRPNSQLYQWLKRESAERGVRGIILRYYTWCDKWHAELQRMKEWSAAPVLGISTGADEAMDGHTISRIEAFLEALQ
jgi:benzoyl-CoA reductase/2-hydroxyglutaryl-CoA dehydratase subunit BcrC/BadD/HgdB